MGAWGIKNFENDDAMEFVEDMNTDDDGWPFVLDAIENVVIVPDDEYVDAYDAARALAAIEYIAAAKGKPSGDFPEDAADWIKNKFTETIEPDTIEDAARALKRIAGNSELKELWEETEDLNAWLEVVGDLEKRLA